MGNLTINIPDEAITIVFQGPVFPDTHEYIRRTRLAMPGAKVILSTFKQPGTSIDIDELVLSPDFGSLPPYKIHKGAPENNINRQILSTQTGMAKVSTPYVAKVRTDCALTSRGFVQLFEAAAQSGRCRIVASSFFTLHPDGIEAFPFHVSDWLLFGRTEDVTSFFNVPYFTKTQATWFDESGHAKSASFFAERYRARFTPEQYLSVMYGRLKGYQTPDSIDDDGPNLIEASRRFLATEFVIAEPQAIGMYHTRHSELSQSGFYRLNCVGFNDWLALCNEIGTLQGSFLPQLDTGKHRTDQTKRRQVQRVFGSRRYWAKRVVIPTLRRARLIPATVKACSISIC